MIKLGLTGGIASGKSTVCNTLRSLGAIIIDADLVAHRVIEPGQPAWQDIVDYFGREVLNADNFINRPALGEMVFDNPEKLIVLNRFTHPRVLEYYINTLAELEQSQRSAVVVLEIPLLFESRMNNLCDEVWVVWVDTETQIKRLIRRNGFDQATAVKRINIQMPLDDKARLADVIIDNSKPECEVSREVSSLFTDLLQKHKIRTC